MSVLSIYYVSNRDVGATAHLGTKQAKSNCTQFTLQITDGKRICQSRKVIGGRIKLGKRRGRGPWLLEPAILANPSLDYGLFCCIICQLVELWVLEEPYRILDTLKAIQYIFS